MRRDIGIRTEVHAESQRLKATEGNLPTLKISTGRPFATMPRSTSQISPRCARFTGLLLGIVGVEERIRRVQQRLTFFEPSRQLAPFLRREFFDGGFDFGHGAHGAGLCDFSAVWQLYGLARHRTLVSRKSLEVTVFILEDKRLARGHKKSATARCASARRSPGRGRRKNQAVAPMTRPASLI